MGSVCAPAAAAPINVHGGSGYIWETEMNGLFRSIKLMEIVAGTTEVRKMLIAENYCGEVAN